MFDFLISSIALFILSVIGIGIGVFILIIAQRKWTKASKFLNESQLRWKSIKRDIENERKEALLKLKEELHKRRSEFELEMKRERLELERFQNKINSFGILIIIL